MGPQLGLEGKGLLGPSGVPEEQLAIRPLPQLMDRQEQEPSRVLRGREPTIPFHQQPALQQLLEGTGDRLPLLLGET
jgi:hypothetical protein